MELTRIISYLCFVVLLVLLTLQSDVHATDANLTVAGNVTHHPDDGHPHTSHHTTISPAPGDTQQDHHEIDWTSTPVIIGIVGAAIGVLGLVIAIVCAVRAGKAQSKVRRLQSKGPEYRELNQMPTA